MLKNAMIGVGLIAAFGLAYVRYAPVYPAQWHVDPAETSRTGKPNDYLVAEGGDIPPVLLEASAADVASALDAVALAEPSTGVLAGAASDGFVTYIQRSKLMGYPDMVSVTLRAEGDGTAVRMYSRSRDGHSDMGVNAARVTRWLEALEAQLPAS